MKGRATMLSVVLGLLLCWGGLADRAMASAEVPVNRHGEPLVLEDQGFIRLAGNFIFIADTSTAMEKPYPGGGMSWLEAEYTALNRINDLLPPLNWQAALYSHARKGLLLEGATQAYHPYTRVEPYIKEDYRAAIAALPSRVNGPPMLQNGLRKLEDLLGLPERTEVLLFSNGKHMTLENYEVEPLKMAAEIAKKYDVCFSVVDYAATPEDRKILQGIAAVNSCSQLIAFEELLNQPERFIGSLVVINDKLIEYLGNDGPDVGNVLFDFNKYFLKPQYKAGLDQVGAWLRDNPKGYVVLSGHTCSIGTERYNIGLSKKRAETVAQYLRDNFHIAEKRIILYWYGFASPVASNTTESGRSLNRRVNIWTRAGH